MNKNVIYRALFPNGKSYIGKTKNFEERKHQHFLASHNLNSQNYHVVFYYAIRKYGWENIEWSIIDEAEKYEDLSEKEKYWIKYYRTYINFENSNGYNMTLGGEDGSAPELFMTQKEIDYILQRFKEIGSITIISNELKCGYNTIRMIIQGEIRTELTGFNNRDFYNKYRNFSENRNLDEVNEVITLSKIHTTKEIESITGIDQRYVQDILSGRIHSKVTGIKRVTREERQYYNPVNSKMTKEEVLNIVDEYFNQHKTIKEIGEIHKKASARISEIILGRTWNKVTGIPKQKKQQKRLKKEDVLKLFKDSEKCKDFKKLAKKYNTTPRNIRRILSGEIWNNITHIK